MNVKNGYEHHGERKGFIFSIDAFVAFLVAMSMVYSLIFLSSVVTSKNDIILQMHSIADDVMVALLSAPSSTGTRLDDVSSNPSLLNWIIPKKYNYKVEINDGSGWITKYTTPGASSVPMFGKVVVYGFSNAINGKRSNIQTYDQNPYVYKSCGAIESGASTSIGLPCSAPKFYTIPNSVKPVVTRLTIWR